MVAVQHFLHQLFNFFCNFLLGLEQNAVHLLAADHFAHGGLGSLNNCTHRIAGAEQELFSAVALLNSILNIEHHVNNVLVVGQHERFFKTLCTASQTDFSLTDGRNVDQSNVLNRIRQVPAETGVGTFGVAAESRHDAVLTFRNNVETGSEPSGQSDNNGGNSHSAGE